MDLFSKVIDSTLDSLNLCKVVFFSLLSQLDKLRSLVLGELVVPLGDQLLSDFSFAEVWHALLD